MKINGKPYTLAKTTLADINALTPLKITQKWQEDFEVCCETETPIDVEGMLFRPFYRFETECEYYPVGTSELVKVRLTPVNPGETVIEDIRRWTDRIMKKYDCTLKEEERSLSEHRVEFSYPDKNEDRWTIKVYTNAAAGEYDITIDVRPIVFE